MVVHLEQRKSRYAAELEKGLLSIATPVWDGTPIEYLKLLEESIAQQNSNGAVEWLVLDNGCTKASVRGYLEELSARFAWVKLHRNEKNEGIVGGMRGCLEQASGRYMCAVDSDDLLYPDCLEIVQWWIKKSGYAPLLYSDEDKIIGTQKVQPYFKPDFDPVLLLNSAYIAHLGVIDRKKALELGAYTDRNAEGSPDWDCFVRFYVAGYEAVHIPEVIYSWRMHPESTADDAGSKPYIHSSQKTVIQRYLNDKQFSDVNEVRYSPLLPGTADWWIERQHVKQAQCLVVREAVTFCDLMKAVSGAPEFVCLLQPGLEPERDDYLWEAQGLFERFPDAGMVGGWVANKGGFVEDGPLVLGFDGACGCPDFGRPVVDPGYFTQLRKQRSVSAVTSRFAVFRRTFLEEAFSAGGFQDAGVWDLGAWMGEFALRRKQRIIFSPFLKCERKSEEITKGSSFKKVAEADNRFYPITFGLNRETAYQLVPLRLRE